MKYWAVIVAALAIAGCEQKKAGGDTAGSGDTTAAAADMTDEQVDEADIPVQEDFEDEAEQQITADSLDDEIAKLEAEISGGE